MKLRRFGFGEYVLESSLDAIGNNAQAAEQAGAVDTNFLGVLTGLVVTQHYVGTVATPNLTVDVSAGAARDEVGLRIPSDDAANVDCSQDHLGASTAVASGKHRCVSIFAKQDVILSDPLSLKSGGTVYRDRTESIAFEVWMGSETLLADPLDQPALMAGYVLLADITLINGQTQVVPGDISTTRRQVWRLRSTAAGADGASFVGAEGYSGVPDPLTAGTVRSQLDELNVSVNLRAKLAGAAFTGAVSAPTLEATTSTVTAKTAVIPTAGKDVQLRGETGQGAVRNASDVLQPFAVGISTADDHALNSRWVDRASAMMTTPQSVASDSEVVLAFDTQEYDSNDLWDVAHGERMTAPADGYYHVDLYGAFEAGAVTNNEEYIALKHSADSRVLAKANSRDALTGNCFTIGIDAYLVHGEYVAAYCYQKNGTAAALTVTGRMTMRRVA